MVEALGRERRRRTGGGTDRRSTTSRHKITLANSLDSCDLDRVRVSEGEIERPTQTERETDRKGERQKERQTDDRDRQTEAEIQRNIYI